MSITKQELGTQHCQELDQPGPYPQEGYIPGESDNKNINEKNKPLKILINAMKETKKVLC